MASLRLLLCTLVAMRSDASSSYVEQAAFLIGLPGDKETLPCHLVDSSKPQMYWFRQHPQKGMDPLFTAYSSGDVFNFTSEQMAAKKTGSTLELQFTKLQLSDSAVYYCACSIGQGADTLYFGSGTRLTVLEDGLNITEPDVTLFDPSPHEINDKGLATLVCLVSRFYPDHLKLSWSVNGVERTAGVRTDDLPTRQSDYMYYMSSRLRLSKMEWLNPQNTFNCTVHFDPTNANISRETSGQDGCGSLTLDSYRKSTNTAWFTYVLLITKSTFYGLFVTLLIWNMKRTGEKNCI